MTNTEHITEDDIDIVVTEIIKRMRMIILEDVPAHLHPLYWEALGHRCFALVADAKKEMEHNR